MASQSTQKRKRGPRAGGADGETRKAILDAALVEFSAHGYRDMTIRAIAERAGVNTKLVHYYFGTKSNLVSALLTGFIKDSHLGEALGAVIGSLVTHDTAATHPLPAFTGADQQLFSPGVWYIATLLNVIESERGGTFLGLVRDAGSNEEERSILTGFVVGTLFAQLPKELQTPQARLKVSLAGSQAIGLIYVRYILKMPDVANAPIEDIAALVGPHIEAYFA